MLSLSELRHVNWDFTGESGAGGFSNYHWYPGRFVPQLAGLLVGNLTDVGDLVLDPFCGSGTTLVEAQRIGRRILGIDVNPIAVLVAQSKLLSWQADDYLAYVGALRQAVTSRLDEALNSDTFADCPNLDENLAWYGPQTLAELALIWRCLGENPSKYQPVAQVAFSSILRFVSSQEKHWGWICDNVKPKRLVHKSAIAPFFQKLDEYPASAAEVSAQRAQFTAEPPDATVVTASCADFLNGYVEESVDSVVTSPPYYSMNDYVRSQRLSFLWFEHDLDAARQKETGARYKRHRLDARQQYLDEMRQCFGGVARVLRPGRPCAVVIGESPNRAGYLEDYLLLMEECGFSEVLSVNRRVAVQRAMTPQVKEESIIVFQREK